MVATCDVCGRERSVSVASLPFAPMSLAFCAECVQRDAFPLWALHGMADMADGPENLTDGFRSFSSFKDGAYISGPAVWACYVPKLIELPSPGKE